MATILKKKYTKDDSLAELLAAIGVLARDRNGRVMKDDHIKWLETKLGEISRLQKIAIKKLD